MLNLHLPIPFRPHLTFIPPHLEEDEYEREEDPEERELRLIELGLHTGLLDVHAKPLYWTSTPPSKAGYWWCKFEGAQDVIQIKAGEEFRTDPRVLWSSCPVQEPGPVERRR